MTDPSLPVRAYAYRVPLNPYDPREGEWSTLVRRTRVQVGDHVNVAVHETRTSSDGSAPEVVIHGSHHKWEVIAIEPREDDGRRAGIRGAKGLDPFWDGLLVLRQVP